MDTDIKHIAELAMIELSDAETEEYRHDIQQMLNMVKELPDCTDDADQAEVNAMKLREDKEEGKTFSRDELLANAPETKEEYISVPQTVNI